MTGKNEKLMALPLDRDRSLGLYESLRGFLPAPGPARTRSSGTDLSGTGAPGPRHTQSLTAILDQFDGLILDGYGVINIGAEPIDGIAGLLQRARALDLPVVVLTNGASFPSSRTAEKYRSWGLDIADHAVVSSRDAVLRQLQSTPPASCLLSLDWASQPLGLDPSSGMEELRAGNHQQLAGQLRHAGAIVMLGTIGWDEQAHQILAAGLIDNPRPLWIANPDISAPQPAGFSAEPGYWAARLLAETGIRPVWIGKPHRPAFELGFERLESLAGRQLDPGRIAMVGDSLHTDILGGSSFGLQTVLVTGYGLLAGADIEAIINKTGIMPDWLAARL